MTAEVLLDRLVCVKKRSADQWSARCPAHADKTPSLSVRDLGDGRVLLHCFAGCSVEEVLGAIGLSFDDLYPERPVENAPRGRRQPITAAQALEVLDLEAMLLVVVASDIAKRRAITDETASRVALAVGRILAVRQEMHS